MEQGAQTSRVQTSAHLYLILLMLIDRLFHQWNPMPNYKNRGGKNDLSESTESIGGSIISLSVSTSW